MIKAGRAGSSPDGIIHEKWQSQPLSVFLDEIGEAVACLNTTVVGLDAVECGHEKPESLNISWAPSDRKAASRKARKFIVEAVLVRVFEALFKHLTTISKLPRFGEIVSGWDGKTDRATKIQEIYDAILDDSYLVSSATLIAHWRNRIVHPASKAKLSPKLKKRLHDKEEEISKRYADLSVDCLLCHFEEARPTLKDVSSLISMSINLAREIDTRISASLTQEDFEAWVSHFELNELITKVISETAPEKRASSVKRVFQTRAPFLVDGYEKYGPAIWFS